MDPLSFAASLMAYCYATGASQSSGGRTVKHNRAVGGHPFSHHLTWTAADVVYDERPPLARAKRLAKRFGLKVVRESDHDHLQAL